MMTDRRKEKESFCYPRLIDLVMEIKIEIIYILADSTPAAAEDSKKNFMRQKRRGQGMNFPQGARERVRALHSTPPSLAGH